MTTQVLLQPDSSSSVSAEDSAHKVPKAKFQVVSDSLTCLTGLLLGARYSGDLGVKPTGFGTLVLRLICMLSHVLEVVPSTWGRGRLEGPRVSELDPGRPSTESLGFR